MRLSCALWIMAMPGSSNSYWKDRLNLSKPALTELKSFVPSQKSKGELKFRKLSNGNSFAKKIERQNNQQQDQQDDNNSSIVTTAYLIGK